MSNIVKLLLVGNPGVGKSTIGNALVNDSSSFNETMYFTEGSGAQAVTTQVKKKARSNALSVTEVVYDVPGFCEAGNANSERNAACLKQAVTEESDKPAKLLLVVSPVGGRVSSDDVKTWQAISSYIPNATEAMVILVNKVDDSEFDEESKAKWMREFQTELRQRLKVPTHVPVVFLHKVSQFGRYAALREKIDAALQCVNPMILVPTHGRIPRSVNDRMSDEAAAAEVHFRRTQDDLRAERERRRNYDEQQRAFAEQKAANARREAEDRMRREREEAERRAREAAAEQAQLARQVAQERRRREEEAEERERSRRQRSQNVVMQLQYVMTPMGLCVMEVPVAQHSGFVGHHSYAPFGGGGFVVMHNDPYQFW
jgi:predicted GTPase